ncbi:MAG: aspartate kinase [Ruminococcaceae bacterium]|nr:aspartate kinase [Oscillospiraceae bacterium]
MIVTKFGGTSMASAEQFKKVKSIIDAKPERQVVVVSAPGKKTSDDVKITDLLYTLHTHLQYGVPYGDIWGMIEGRYLEIEEDLGLDCDIASELARIKSQLKKGMDQNYLISRGEYLAAKLMSSYLGFDFVDSKDIIRFTYSGTVDLERSEQNAKKAFSSHGNIVVPGFYGSYPNGDICLFSRGGSDITGSYLARFLDARIYENWTDVPGTLAADPRIVENPKTISQITYTELRELSYMGANVLHEDSISPLQEKNISINIRNTNEPSCPGTIIKRDCNDDSSIITGISGKKDFVSFDILKDHMSTEIGFTRRVLEIFEDYKINVEHIPTGIDSASVIVSGASVAGCMYDIVSKIESELGAKVRAKKEMALIAIVGRNMVGKSGICARIFASLSAVGINIKMIAQPPDETNIIVGVDNNNYQKAIKALYDDFKSVDWI